MGVTPSGENVYCLRVIEKTLTEKATIVSFEFGTFESNGTTPTFVEALNKKYPFLLKQSLEAVEVGIGVYPYGAIVQSAEPMGDDTKCKLHVVPCGDISHLPDGLIEDFNANGYLETNDDVDPVLCELGNVFTIGATGASDNTPHT